MNTKTHMLVASAAYAVVNLREPTVTNCVIMGLTGIATHFLIDKLPHVDLKTWFRQPDKNEKYPDEPGDGEMTLNYQDVVFAAMLVLLLWMTVFHFSLPYLFACGGAFLPDLTWHPKIATGIGQRFLGFYYWHADLYAMKYADRHAAKHVIIPWILDGVSVTLIVIRFHYPL